MIKDEKRNNMSFYSYMNPTHQATLVHTPIGRFKRYQQLHLPIVFHPATYGCGDCCGWKYRLLTAWLKLDILLAIPPACSVLRYASSNADCVTLASTLQKEYNQPQSHIIKVVCKKYVPERSLKLLPMLGELGPALPRFGESIPAITDLLLGLLL